MYTYNTYIIIIIYINYTTFYLAMFPPPVNRGPHARGPAPSKSKVFSILDRARAAMDQGYK